MYKSFCVIKCIDSFTIPIPYPELSHYKSHHRRKLHLIHNSVACVKFYKVHNSTCNQFKDVKTYTY